MADDRLSADEQTEIVCLMLNKEQEGVVRLLRAYARRVKWLLLDKFDGLLTSEDADEIIQTAAFNAWNHADQFDDKEGNPGGWFYTIAYHAAVDELRRQPDGQDRPAELSVDPEAESRSPACLEGDEPPPEIEQDLLAEIETLGEKQKLIIKADMAAGGEADAEALAKRLDIPKQHVYSYRNKAHAALLKRMQKRGHTGESVRMNK